MHNVQANSPLSKEQVRACRASIRKGSKSFYFASLVLPVEVRSAASALYAFCRVSDDIADSPHATPQSIASLKRRLDAVYSEQPHSNTVDEAFAHVVSQYEIPYEVPASMLEGFEWDVSGRQYENLSDVLDYAARVAGTVGVMMTIIMKRRSANTLARACDLGVAMQLTNIARDLGEDARNGRLYLPREWMREEGVDPDKFLEAPVFTPELARVVARLLAEADRIYARSLTGLVELPVVCRTGIRAAGLVYAEIGSQIRRNDFESVSQRAHTSRFKKFVLLARALSGTFAGGSCDESPAMKECAYLVRLAARSGIRTKGSGEWLIDLIGQLNHRDQALVFNRPTRVGRSVRV